jgi:hypothetical protein
MSVDDRELREIGSGFVSHAQDQQSAVVVRGHACAAVLVGGGENIAGNIARGMIRGDAREQRSQAIMAEFLLIGIFRLVDAIGGEKNDVARLKLYGGFLVFGFREKTERHAIHANFLHRAFAHEKGIGSAGIRESKTPRTGIVNREDHGDEARIQPRAMEAAVEHRQHFGRRTGMRDNVLTHDADGQRAEERGGGAFAGNIAESDGEAAFSVGKKIVEIAAQFARGAIPSGEVEAGNLARAGGRSWR